MKAYFKNLKKAAAMLIPSAIMALFIIPNDAMSDTVKEFSGRTVTFENLTINQIDTNVATVAPGANINVAVDWRSEYTSTYCPGCVQQFYIGVKDQSIDCMYSGGTSFNVSGSGALSFTAPTEPGVYPIHADSSLQFSCTKTEAGISDVVPEALGYILVDDADGSVSREFSGRTVSFNNISLNSSGENHVRVFPGATVDVDLDWSSVYTSTYCPGCVQQYYIGVKDQAIECLYSGNTAYTSPSGASTLNFTAPTEPGVYVVQAKSTLDFSCVSTAASLSDQAEGAIATFEVIEY